MEESQGEIPVKQRGNNFDYLKAYQWQKGQSGNPAGRPKEKTLKEFAREFLANLSDEDRIAYLKSVDPKIVWEMSEGKPHNVIDLNAKVTIADTLKDIENGNRGQTTSEQVIEQVVADITAIQDTGQEEEPVDIPAEQSSGTLPAAQMVEKYNPEEQATGIHD